MPYGEGRIHARKGLFHLILIALGIVAFQATSSPSARESDRESELAITQAAATHQVGAEPAFQAENPKNNLRILFQPSGVAIEPRWGQAGGWSIDLSLAAIGSEASPSSPGSARLSTSGNRIDYDYGAVRQWYKNERKQFLRDRHLRHRRARHQRSGVPVTKFFESAFA